MLGGIKLDDYAKLLEQQTDLLSYLPTPEGVNFEHYDVMVDRKVGDTLLPLEPDILGECFVLNHLQPPERGIDPTAKLQRFIESALDQDALAAVTFLNRAAKDFPDHPTLMPALIGRKLPENPVGKDIFWSVTLAFCLPALVKNGRPDDAQTLIDLLQIAASTSRPYSHALSFALFNRGVARGELDPSETQGELDDYTAVIEMSDAPAQQRAKAYNNRGSTRGQLQPPDTQGAIDDYTVVIEMSDAPVEQRAKAYFNRGVARGKLQTPDTQGAIDDFTAVIEMSDAPAEQRAQAYVNRGVARGKLQTPDTQGKLDDYTAVIEMSDAPAEQRAKAYNNRGITRGELQTPDTQGAIDDFTAVIEMSDAPAEQRAKAYVNRGVARGKLQTPDTQGAIDDYTAVIETSDAPAEQRAQAYVNRGVARAQLQTPDPQGMLDDFKTVIEMSDAPADQQAKAAGNLGLIFHAAGEKEKGCELFRLSIEWFEADGQLEESERVKQIYARLCEPS